MIFPTWLASRAETIRSIKTLPPIESRALGLPILLDSPADSTTPTIIISSHPAFSGKPKKISLLISCGLPIIKFFLSQTSISQVAGVCGEETLMESYDAVDLQSNNCAGPIVDKKDRLLYEQRFPDLVEWATDLPWP